METTPKVNYSFKILYAIGIILVICGHYGASVLTLGNLYPYDTFHIPMFVFVSGYFYKNTNSSSFKALCRYVKKKTLHLLIPYFLWNCVYALISLILAHNPFYPFEMGADVPFDFYTFIVRPFQKGDGFILNVAAWYLVVLFCVEILNAILKYIMNKLHIFSETVYGVFCFILGYGAIVLAQSSWESSWKICIVRIFYLLFYYELGLCYKLYWEKKADNINNIVYISGNIVITCALIFLSGNKFPIVYAGVFPSTPIYTIIRALLGISLWVRIAKILTPILKENKTVMFVANHTFSYMMHQGVVGMGINAGILLLSHLFGMFQEFDGNAFRSEIWYAYTVNGLEELHIIYVILIVYIIMLVLRLWEKIKPEIAEKVRQRNFARRN